MTAKSRRFGTGTLSWKTGREGPQHDPYGYEEWTITRNDHRATLHLGLVDYVSIDGKRRDDSVSECVSQFETFAGISLKACERAIHRYLPCCAYPDIKRFAGYPGEHISMCQACGKNVDYDFDIGAVI